MESFADSSRQVSKPKIVAQWAILGLLIGGLVNGSIYAYSRYKASPSPNPMQPSVAQSIVRDVLASEAKRGSEVVESTHTWALSHLRERISHHADESEFFINSNDCTAWTAEQLKSQLIKDGFKVTNDDCYFKIDLRPVYKE